MGAEGFGGWLAWRELRFSAEGLRFSAVGVARTKSSKSIPDHSKITTATKNLSF